MRKLFVVFLLILSVAVQGQNKILQVEGKLPELYLTHVVAPKESYYSIGRLYNQAPKAIAALNALQFDKGLSIGQVIKVPVTGLNFEVNDKAGADETLVPVQHIVAKNETLFRISTNYGASLDAIRKWNNLSSDNIEIGTSLIVGQLKIKNDQLASFNAATSINATAKAPGTTPVETKRDAATFENVAPEKKTEPEKKFIPVTDTALYQAEPQKQVKAPVADTSLYKAEPLVIKKEEALQSTKVAEAKAPVAEKKVAENTPAASTTKANNIDLSSAGGVAPGEGVFAGNFAATQGMDLQSKNGEAATFKSTSGWQDKKYYALINNVPVGTIVKITAGAKAVYAKVLDVLPQMKENNGILLRLSNSAASYLGIIDPKFPVQISYYQ